MASKYRQKEDIKKGENMEFLIIAAIVAAVGFAVYYILQEAKERGDAWKEKQFSFGGKLLLLLNVLLTFAGVIGTCYFFLNTADATWGLVSAAVMVICSVISAYVTSPLRVFVVPTNVDSGNGCAYMIYMPLMIAVMLVSLAMVILVSWIFALMAIFRGVNKGITAIVLILLAALVASPWIVQRVQYRQAALEEQRLEQEAEARKEREKQLTSAIVEKVKGTLQSELVKDLELTEEEKNFVHSTTQNVFAIKEVRREVAYKLSELYGDKDVEGLLRISGSLAVNNALSGAWNEKGVNICFTSGFLKLIREEVMANGTFREEGSICDVYLYRGYEVWIDRSNQFIGVYPDMNGARVSVIYSSLTHMNETLEKYDDPKVDYYLVGSSVDYKTVNATNTGTTTQKKGNCSRCSGTGKVTKHFGNSWNKKPGYQYGKTCGACNGTGWVK